MFKNMFRKGLILGIIVLFVGASVIPSTIGTIEKKTTFTVFMSPGYIQDLINNASDGDTIYIPSGTYYENLVINKSISVIGEDKNTTIIDSGGIVEDVISITSDWVNISGFTIRNGLEGIDIDSDYNTIHNNIFINNYCGIYLGSSSYNNIKDNDITSNKGNGISVSSCYHITITGNTINSNVDDGIVLRLSSYNTITNNIISNNTNGVYLGGSSSNTITGNTFSDNDYCIFLRFLIIWQNNFPSRNNTISNNNFLGYKQHTFCGGGWSNKWMENYWNRPRMFPKLILGAILLGFYGFASIPIILPWFNIDRHPAQEQYAIKV